MSDIETTPEGLVIDWSKFRKPDDAKMKELIDSALRLLTDEVARDERSSCVGIGCGKCPMYDGYWEIQNCILLSSGKDRHKNQPFARAFLRRYNRTDDIVLGTPRTSSPDGLPVTELKTGHWYKWVGPKKRPEHWNARGEMDFMLDGKPHFCTYGHSKYGVFCDSPDPKWDWTWIDGFEHFREVPPPVDQSQGHGHGMQKTATTGPINCRCFPIKFTQEFVDALEPRHQSPAARRQDIIKTL